MSGEPIEPFEIVSLVDRYVDQELREVDRYENREPLDEGGVWTLHRLAAEIYAQGFRAGESAASMREAARRSRAKEHAKPREVAE